MYRIIYFLLLIYAVPNFAQRIPPPKPVIIKVTATWCNVCGLDAWDSFKFLAEEFEKDAVILAVHASPLSQLHSPTAEAIANNLPDRLGQPELFLDDTYVDINWISNTRDYIQSTQMKDPIAHVFLSHEIVDNKIQATASIQFLKESNREHYLGLYVVENHVTAFQNSRGPEDKHSKILRTHFRESPFGTLITEANIEKDAIFEAQYSMPVDTAWQVENIELAAIIWEKSGDQYHVINANTSLAASLSTATSNSFLRNIQFDILPTLVEQDAAIHLSVPTLLPSARLELLNLNGTVISTIYQGVINSGNTTFALPIPAALSNGTYLVLLEAKGESLVRKLVLKK